jgi:hypothetical protein
VIFVVALRTTVPRSLKEIEVFNVRPHDATITSTMPRTHKSHPPEKKVLPADRSVEVAIIYRVALSSIVIMLRLPLL